MYKYYTRFNNKTINNRSYIICDFILDENDVYMFHIHYCNDAYKRNWIKVNQLTEFVNKSSIYNEFPKLLVS